MAQPPETFARYLERTLADSGLRSRGHNKPEDQDAEDMCYQRAIDCFGHPLWGPGRGGFKAPTTPPAHPVPSWGIHSPEDEEARHEAALGDQRNDGTGCYFDGTPRTGNVFPPASRQPYVPATAEPVTHDCAPGGVFPPWGRNPHVPAPAEPVHNDGTMTYSFDAAARGLVQHHLDRIRLHLTQIGHVMDANLDK